MKWKLQSRTNRTGHVTTFNYDDVNRVTTVTAPLSRVTKYAYDAEGKVTGITNPKNETTNLLWSADRHVTKVTEPTNAFTELLQKDPDGDAPPARVEDGLSNRFGVELLDRDVKRRLGLGNENPR